MSIFSKRPAKIRNPEGSLYSSQSNFHRKRDDICLATRFLWYDGFLLHFCRDFHGNAVKSLMSRKFSRSNLYFGYRHYGTAEKQISDFFLAPKILFVNLLIGIMVFGGLYILFSTNYRSILFITARLSK